MSLYVSVPWWVKVAPDRLKTLKMCNEAVHIEPYALDYISDRFKTQEMCNEA